MLIRLLSVALVVANIAFQAMAAPHVHVLQNGSALTVLKHVHVAGHALAGHSHSSKDDVDDSTSMPLDSNEHDTDAIYIEDIACERNVSAAAIEAGLINQAIFSPECWSDSSGNDPSVNCMNHATAANVSQTCDLYLLLRTLRI